MWLLTFNNLTDFNHIGSMCERTKFKPPECHLQSDATVTIIIDQDWQ